MALLQKRPIISMIGTSAMFSMLVCVLCDIKHVLWCCRKKTRKSAISAKEPNNSTNEVLSSPQKSRTYPEKSIQYTPKSRKRPAKVPGKSPVYLHMSAGTLPMTDLPQQVFPQKSPIYRQKSSVFE